MLIIYFWLEAYMTPLPFLIWYLVITAKYILINTSPNFREFKKTKNCKQLILIVLKILGPLRKCKFVSANLHHKLLNWEFEKLSSKRKCNTWFGLKIQFWGCCFLSVGSQNFVAKRLGCKREKIKNNMISVWATN